jgi:ribosomal protein L37E
MCGEQSHYLRDLYCSYEGYPMPLDGLQKSSMAMMARQSEQSDHSEE